MILEFIYERLDAVPVFPKVAHRVLELLDDPRTTIPQLAEVIRYDPAITANFLKYCNSAHFGLAQKVTSLEVALSLLGQEETRKAIMLSCSAPYLNQALKGYELSPEELWDHSMGAAVASQILAEAVGFSDRATLFTAALLHDIGEIVLNLFVHDFRDELRQMSEEKGISFTEAEWQVLGGDHAIIGSELLRRWEFPEEIVRAIREHHDPDLFIQSDLSALVALSDIILREIGIGVGADGFRYHLDERIVNKYKLSPEAILKLTVRVWQEFEKIKESLKV
ncbi:HDOD domain-containing protein [Thermosulfuriphilus sp.]